MSASLLPLDLTSGSAVLTAALCDIESVSGNEKALADAIVQALTGYSHLELTREGNTVVARTNLGRPQRVIIAGHLDTVPVNENLPSRFEKDSLGDEWLWGRGTVDMKAGVAVQLTLAVELSAPTYDITWIWYDLEEVDSDRNGLGRLVRTHPEFFVGDFAILGEPSNSTVEGGCNGTIRVDIRARGLRAHSARSWAGENAIHKLSSALAILSAYEPRQVEVEGLVYREGLNAVGVSGGLATNVIPDEATLHVNYRFAPNRSAAEAITFVRALFDGFDVVVVDQAEGARPGLTSAIAHDFVTAVGAVPTPKYGWTDVARFSAMGIPAVNFGPGDATLAHADDERVAVHQIIECENALRTWLLGE
jgi:succinyl-diaminopimelate desuccinylase